MVTKWPPLGFLANWLATPLILNEPGGGSHYLLDDELCMQMYCYQGFCCEMLDHEPTSPLHVVQFNVNLARRVEWQCGLAPWDHRSTDDIQRAASDSFTCLSEHLYGDAVC